MEEGDYYGQGEGEEGQEFQGSGELPFNQEQLMAITQAVFEAVDTDGSGFIEANEFYKLVSEISQQLGIPQLSEEDALEVLNQLDANKDGKLSLEEFYVLVQ